MLNAAYLFYYASDAIFSPGGSSDDAERHEAKAKSKLADRLNALSQDMLVVAQNVSNSQGLGSTSSYGRRKAYTLGWIRCRECLDMSRQQYLLDRAEGKSSSRSSIL